MTQDELNKILAERWLADNSKGKRADLSDAVIFDGWRPTK